MSESTVGIIYVTTNILNGKRYVGLHTRGKSWYLGSGHVLANAIKKYGRENFIRRTIDEFDSIEEGCAKERFWITEMNTKAPRGYNLNAGGEGQFNPCKAIRAKMSASHIGNHVSEETRVKISAHHAMRQPETRARLTANLSAVHTGNKYCAGCHPSAEALAKRSASMMGHPVSEETRAKLSASLKGNRNCRGCHRSVELRAKYSAVRTAYWAKRKALEARP